MRSLDLHSGRLSALFQNHFHANHMRSLKFKSFHDGSNLRKSRCICVGFKGAQLVFVFGRVDIEKKEKLFMIIFDHFGQILRRFTVLRGGMCSNLFTQFESDVLCLWLALQHPRRKIHAPSKCFTVLLHLVACPVRGRGIHYPMSLSHSDLAENLCARIRDQFRCVLYPWATRM